MAAVKGKSTKSGRSGELKFNNVDTKVCNQKNEVITDGEAQIIVM